MPIAFTLYCIFLLKKRENDWILGPYLGLQCIGPLLVRNIRKYSWHWGFFYVNIPNWSNVLILYFKKLIEIIPYLSKFGWWGAIKMSSSNYA